MKTQSSILALFLLLPVACKHDEGHSGHAEHSEHAKAGSSELALNAGKKWDADDHTVQRVAAMGKIVEAAKAKGDLAAADYAAVHKQLQAEIQSMIKGCTMKGPAHDELHKFLGMLHTRMTDLGGSDLAKAKLALAEIHGLTQKFSNFFE